MNFRNAIVFGFIAGMVAVPLHAQNMDVDQADTIDFQSFHKDKKEAIKVWDNKSSTPTKAYSDKPADTKAASSNTQSTETAVTSGKAAPSTDSTATAAKPAAAVAAATTDGDIKGKRFEIRERYTLTRSTQTPYSAFYVIEPLYKQSAQLCPKGWRKLAERSEPIEQDFYLYYEIECL